MSNSLKFDDICVNTDNFVQNGETIQELTVTITLSEYRRLLAESFELGKLENRVKELEIINKSCIEWIMAKTPELTKSFTECLNKVISNFKEETQSEGVSLEEFAKTLPQKFK